MYKSEDKRKGWLANLQEGDELFCRTGKEYLLVRVDSVSQKGRITVSDKSSPSFVEIFDADGVLRDPPRPISQLMQPTSERLEHLRLCQAFAKALRKLSQAETRMSEIRELQRSSERTPSLEDRALLSKILLDIGVIADDIDELVCRYGE